MRLSERHPLLYYSRIEQKRLARRLKNVWARTRFARQYGEPLPYRCKRHQSLLRRKLGDSDPQLQENKITNLRIASRAIDRIMIAPGETFSFWQLVGRTTKEKGYIEGMQLAMGEVKTGVGGGICQLANLLYWLALHTPLEVVERHHHSFDPFPDSGRTLPFGSGASVFYNYVDLRFYNPTTTVFQLHVFLTAEHLKGEVRTNEPLPYSYHIEERAHRFLKKGDNYYRENEIWRRTVDKISGETVNVELLIRNFSEVKYEVAPGSYICIDE